MIKHHPKNIVAFTPMIFGVIWRVSLSLDSMKPQIRGLSKIVSIFIKWRASIAEMRSAIFISKA